MNKGRKKQKQMLLARDIEGGYAKESQQRVTDQHQGNRTSRCSSVMEVIGNRRRMPSLIMSTPYDDDDDFGTHNTSVTT